MQSSVGDDAEVELTEIECTRQQDVGSGGDAKAPPGRWRTWRVRPDQADPRPPDAAPLGYLDEHGYVVGKLREPPAQHRRRSDVREGRVGREDGLPGGQSFDEGEVVGSS